MISQKQSTGVVERQGVEERGGVEISRAALIGTAATILAVIFSMAMTAAFGDQYFDWLSFPFGALGFVACAIAAAADRRPKKLAYVMLCINMAYWVYFCVNLPGPAAAH